MKSLLFVLSIVIILTTPLIIGQPIAGAADVEEEPTQNLSSFVDIFRCMFSPTIAKCMKVFLIQKVERRTANGSYKNSGNLTADFLDQMLQPIDDDDDDGKTDSMAKTAQYMAMNDSSVNERLRHSLGSYFNGREITLNLLPGMQIRVMASPDNSIDFSVEKSMFIFT